MSLNYIIKSPLEQFEINTFLGLSSSILDISFINVTSFTLYVLLVLGVYYFINVFTLKNGKLVSTN